MYADAGPVFLAAMQYDGTFIWGRVNFPNAPFKVPLEQASIAVESETVFWALSNRNDYLNDGFNYTNGLFSFNGSNGHQNWYIPCIPKSSISVGNGMIIYIF